MEHLLGAIQPGNLDCGLELTFEEKLNGWFYAGDVGQRSFEEIVAADGALKNARLDRDSVPAGSAGADALQFDGDLQDFTPRILAASSDLQQVQGYCSTTLSPSIRQQ